MVWGYYNPPPQKKTPSRTVVNYRKPLSFLWADFVNKFFVSPFNHFRTTLFWYRKDRGGGGDSIPHLILLKIGR